MLVRRARTGFFLLLLAACSNHEHFPVSVVAAHTQNFIIDALKKESESPLLWHPTKKAC